MFHFIHNWVKFRITKANGNDERLRKCTKCGKMEQIAGAGVYGAEWIPARPDSFSEANQTIIRMKLKQMEW